MVRLCDADGMSERRPAGRPAPTPNADGGSGRPRTSGRVGATGRTGAAPHGDQAAVTKLVV